MKDIIFNVKNDATILGQLNNFAPWELFERLGKSITDGCGVSSPHMLNQTHCKQPRDTYDLYKYRQRGNTSTLVKVVDIVDVSDGFDLLRGWMEQPAPEHRGGSQSDDVPEDHTPYNYTVEEIGTFFKLVTIFRNSRGQFVAVDCQGYNYWRYVYISAYWREMFAEEVKDNNLNFYQYGNNRQLV